MVNMMVKGHTLGLMEVNMLGNGQMGKQNGHGTVTSKDGKYVGEWKGNDFHGQGTMILLMGQNGQVISEGINLGTSNYSTKAETSKESG